MYVLEVRRKGEADRRRVERRTRDGAVCDTVCALAFDQYVAFLYQDRLSWPRPARRQQTAQMVDIREGRVETNSVRANAVHTNNAFTSLTVRIALPKTRPSLTRPPSPPMAPVLTFHRPPWNRSTPSPIHVLPQFTSLLSYPPRPPSPPPHSPSTALPTLHFTRCSMAEKSY